jgi:hypothetical protein
MNPLSAGSFRIPSALRRVPPERMARLLPVPSDPQPGDIALARVLTIGKNTRLELVSGRASTLQEGDEIAVVFGNRYAASQFEGYARCNGDSCDLMSMAGVCGVVTSKHDKVVDPSRLKLLGAIGDASGRPLRLRDFALTPAAPAPRPRVVAVCGTAMDAGKTHTVMSLIVGLRKLGEQVGGVKLTGIASGRDAFVMYDAGARPVYDFVDAGLASTFRAPAQELLDVYELLIGHAAAAGARWVVMEIADGLLERETQALMRNREFTSSIDSWVFAGIESMAAVAGVEMLRSWGIVPLGVSGILSMSPLTMGEVTQNCGIPCYTSAQLRGGVLNSQLAPAAPARAQAAR